MTKGGDSEMEAYAQHDAVQLFSAFRKVAGTLNMTHPAQAAILGVSQATLDGWGTTPNMTADELDRIALFVGIYGLAAQAFPGERGAEGWLRRPNTAGIFGGESPIEVLIRGRSECLALTYDHLQALVRVH